MTSRSNSLGSVTGGILADARSFAQMAYALRPEYHILDAFKLPEYKALQDEQARMSRHDLMRRMDQKAESVFSRQFARSKGNIIVPLSGGRDSRFILGMALKLGLRDRLVAVTFGVPNMWDFDLPVALGKKLGIRHEAVDLTGMKINLADLKRAHDNGAFWTDLVWSHINQAWTRFAGPHCRAYSGYFGDPCAGSRYFDGHEHLSLEQAEEHFDKANILPWAFGGPFRIKTLRDDYVHQFVAPDRMTYSEQMLMTIKQDGGVRRAIAPNHLPIDKPFSDPEWMTFTFGLPRDMRRGCNLYLEYLLDRFPVEFSVGTSNAKGHIESLAPKSRFVSRAIQSVKRRVFRETLGLPVVHSGWKYGGEEMLLKSLEASGLSGGTAAQDRLSKALAGLRASVSGKAQESFGRPRLNFMLLCNLVFSAHADAPRAAVAAS